jgi:hypothetical protein
MMMIDPQEGGELRRRGDEELPLIPVRHPIIINWVRTLLKRFLSDLHG